MQRRQTIAFSIVATSFAPQGFTKAATPPSISFGDVEDAQAFGLNEWIRGLRLDGDHASPSIARPATKLGRTRQPGPLRISEAAWASSPQRLYTFYGNLQTGAHSLDFVAASHSHRPPSSSSAKTTASSDSFVGLLGKTTGAIWISFGIASILRVLFGPVPPRQPAFVAYGISARNPRTACGIAALALSRCRSITMSS